MPVSDSRDDLSAIVPASACDLWPGWGVCSLVVGQACAPALSCDLGGGRRHGRRLWQEQGGAVQGADRGGREGGQLASRGGLQLAGAAEEVFRRHARREAGARGASALG